MLNYLNFPILLLIITIYPDQVEAIGPFSNTALTVILLTVLLVSIVGIFLCRTLGSKCQRESDTLGVSQVEVYDTDPKTIQGSIVPSYWTDADIRSYLLARTFEQQFPPKDPDITSEQFSLINERGVGAWEMEKYSYMNVMIRENTEVTFLSDECCVQSNLPFPQWEDVCYYEVKIFEKPADTMVAIGVASKPYPSWRFPGLNRHSVGYYSTGQKYCNDSFEGKPYGSLYNEGDVIGCGYRTRSGSIFFTRNGETLKSAITGFHFGIYPAIAADGPCTLHVNFGLRGFVLGEANVKKWGFGPVVEAPPPPAYGIAEDTLVPESESDCNEEELSFLRIPRRYRNIVQSNSLSRNISRNSLSFLSEISISIFDESCDQPSQLDIPSTDVTFPPPAYSPSRTSSHIKKPDSPPKA